MMPNLNDKKWTENLFKAKVDISPYLKKNEFVQFNGYIVDFDFVANRYLKSKSIVYHSAEGKTYSLPEELFKEEDFELIGPITTNFKVLDTRSGYQTLNRRHIFGTQPYLGADPEIFITSPTGVVPAFEFLPPKSATYGRPFWDGFQAEFTVEPQTCIAYLTDKVQHGLANLYKQITTKLPPSTTLNPACCLPIPTTTLNTTSDKHVALGCEPSKNVYNLTTSIPLDGRQLPFRFAGYHCHIELANHKPKDSPWVACKSDIEGIVRILDKIPAVFSVALFQDLESPIRRQYYGLAGEYRTPKHGLEYRTLSSCVLWHPAFHHLIWNLVRFALKMQVTGFGGVWDASEEETIDTINTLDVRRARKIILRNKEILYHFLQGTYNCQAPIAPKVINSLTTKGIKEFIDLDVVQNWRLKDYWELHAASKDCCFQNWLFHHNKELAKIK